MRDLDWSHRCDSQRGKELKSTKGEGEMKKIPARTAIDTFFFSMTAWTLNGIVLTWL